MFMTLQKTSCYSCKAGNPDYKHKKNFLSELREDPDYSKLSTKKNIRNRSYL